MNAEMLTEGAESVDARPIDYEYREGKWKTITIPITDGLQCLEDAMHSLGYSTCQEFTLGPERGSFWAQVYRREKTTAPGEFWVELSTPFYSNTIICPQLPDLLQLLQQLAPIIRSTMDADHAREQWEHFRDHEMTSDKVCRFCQARKEAEHLAR